MRRKRLSGGALWPQAIDAVHGRTGPGITVPAVIDEGLALAGVKVEVDRLSEFVQDRALSRMKMEITSHFRRKDAVGDPIWHREDVPDGDDRYYMTYELTDGLLEQLAQRQPAARDVHFTTRPTDYRRVLAIKRREGVSPQEAFARLHRVA